MWLGSMLLTSVGCAIIPTAAPTPGATVVQTQTAPASGPGPEGVDRPSPQPDVVVRRVSAPVDRHGARRRVGRLGRWLDELAEYRRQRWVDRLEDVEIDDDDDIEFDLFETSTAATDCR